MAGLGTGSPYAGEVSGQEGVKNMSRSERERTEGTSHHSFTTEDY